ncbi:hypothetical protein Tco_0638106 [Tanacetum coccineum]
MPMSSAFNIKCLGMYTLESTVWKYVLDTLGIEWRRPILAFAWASNTTSNAEKGRPGVAEVVYASTAKAERDLN